MEVSEIQNKQMDLFATKGLIQNHILESLAKSDIIVRSDLRSISSSLGEVIRRFTTLTSDEKVSINFIRLVLLLSKRTRGNDNSKNNRGVRFHMGTSAGHNCGKGREVFTRFVIFVFFSLLQLLRQTSKRACKSIQTSFVIQKSVKG